MIAVSPWRCYDPEATAFVGAAGEKVSRVLLVLGLFVGNVVDVLAVNDITLGRFSSVCFGVPGLPCRRCKGRHLGDDAALQSNSSLGSSLPPAA